MSDPTAINVGNVGWFTDPQEIMIDAYTSHGRHHVHMPFITPVADNLWHGGVTAGLVLPEFIKHVLSLYQWEAYTIGHKGVEVRTVEMYDSVDQDTSQIEELAEWVNEARKTGPVLVHCQAGLNRSSLVIAKALLMSGEVANGREAVDLLREKRSPGVLCNPKFEEWVLSHE